MNLGAKLHDASKFQRRFCLQNLTLSLHFDWLSFNFGVVCSFYIDQLVTRSTAWVSRVYHTVTASLFIRVLCRPWLSCCTITLNASSEQLRSKNLTAVMQYYIS
jgi:hypothetical protein